LKSQKKARHLSLMVELNKSEQSKTFVAYGCIEKLEQSKTFIAYGSIEKARQSQPRLAVQRSLFAPRPPCLITPLTSQNTPRSLTLDPDTPLTLTFDVPHHQQREVRAEV
jgi:hypothetical protein